MRTSLTRWSNVLPVVLLGAAGCVSSASPGTLEAIHEQAARKAMERCLKTGFTTNRYVPLLTLAAACERMVYRNPSFRQPVRPAVPG
jgi:hypothetical protein